MFFTDPHLIDLTNVDLNGRILDVGGGGEIKEIRLLQ